MPVVKGLPERPKREDFLFPNTGSQDLNVGLDVEKYIKALLDYIEALEDRLDIELFNGGSKA